MSDAASWILNVPISPWNEMYVAVKNGLPRALAIVYADIKAGDPRVRNLDLPPRLVYQLRAGVHLTLAEIKVA